MMYKVLLLKKKKKKVRLHDGAELRATASCKIIQALCVGCGGEGGVCQQVSFFFFENMDFPTVNDISSVMSI